jgi:hypothetical protein
VYVVFIAFAIVCNVIKSPLVIHAKSSPPIKSILTSDKILCSCIRGLAVKDLSNIADTSKGSNSFAQITSGSFKLSKYTSPKGIVVVVLEEVNDVEDVVDIVEYVDDVVE